MHNSKPKPGGSKRRLSAAASCPTHLHGTRVGRQRSRWPQLQRQQRSLLHRQQLDCSFQEGGRGRAEQSGSNQYALAILPTRQAQYTQTFQQAPMPLSSTPAAVAAATGATAPCAAGRGTGVGLALNAVTRWGSVCSRPAAGGWEQTAVNGGKCGTAQQLCNNSAALCNNCATTVRPVQCRPACQTWMPSATFISTHRAAQAWGPGAVQTAWHLAAFRTAAAAATATPGRRWPLP